LIPDFEDIAEYIIDHYKNKVVEVGVGSLPHVALLLKDKMDVIVTDVNEQNIAGVIFALMHIFNPDMGIYRNACLIYSIRPPIDYRMRSQDCKRSRL